MTAKPYDNGAVHHLDWAVFCGPSYVFVYFAGAGWSNSPSGDTFEITGYDESPAGEQAFPGCDLDRNAVFNAFEGVVNTPVVCSVAGLGRRTWPVSIGRVVV